MLSKIQTFFRYVAIGMVALGLVFGIGSKLLRGSVDAGAPRQNSGERMIRQNEQIYNLLTNDPAITQNPVAHLLATAYKNNMCALIGQLCEHPKDFSRSVLGGSANIVGTAYTSIPASGVGETYRAIAGAGLAPQTQAAEGIGFGALSGFRKLWLVFRNFSYGVLVLVMVIVSLMIMFRMKLGTQTAITIETALPRIVLSLILITFSYAIAGFLIDIMYVVMGLTVTLMCAGGEYCNTVETISTYLNATPSDIYTGLFPRIAAYNAPGAIPPPAFILGASNIWDLAQALIDIFPATIKTGIYTLGTVLNYVVTGYILSLYQKSSLGEILSGISLFTFSAGQAPKSIMTASLMFIAMSTVSAISIPFVVFVVLLLTIIFLFFRIYFLLFFTFLKIMLYVTFAPLYMLIEAVPGQKSFSTWFKNIFGELMTFPIVGGLFLFASVMVNNFNDGTDPASTLPTMWAPPFLNGLDQQAFLMVLGMGLVFLIPDLTKTVKKMLGVTDVGINFGLGTFFAGAAVVAAGGMGVLAKGQGITDFMYGKDAASRRVGFYGWVDKFTKDARAPFRPSPKVDQEKIAKKRKRDNETVARTLAEQRVSGSATNLSTAAGRRMRDDDINFTMQEHEWLENEVTSATAHIDPSNQHQADRIRYEKEADFRAVSSAARQQIATEKGIDHTLTAEGRNEIRELTRKGMQAKNEASATAMSHMESAGINRFTSERGEEVYRDERQFAEQLTDMRNRQVDEALSKIDKSDIAAREKALGDVRSRFDIAVKDARAKVRSSGVDPLTFKGRQQIQNEVQQAMHIQTTVPVQVPSQGPANQSTQQSFQSAGGSTASAQQHSSDPQQATDASTDQTGSADGVRDEANTDDNSNQSG